MANNNLTAQTTEAIWSVPMIAMPDSISAQKLRAAGLWMTYILQQSLPLHEWNVYSN